MKALECKNDMPSPDASSWNLKGRLRAVGPQPRWNFPKSDPCQTRSFGTVQKRFKAIGLQSTTMSGVFAGTIVYHELVPQPISDASLFSLIKHA